MKKKILISLGVCGLLFCTIFAFADEWPPGIYCGSTVLSCGGDYCTLINNKTYKEKVYFGTKVYCCGQICDPMELGQKCLNPNSPEE